MSTGFERFLWYTKIIPFSNITTGTLKKVSSESLIRLSTQKLCLSFNHELKRFCATTLESTRSKVGCHYKVYFIHCVCWNKNVSSSTSYRLHLLFVVKKAWCNGNSVSFRWRWRGFPERERDATPHDNTPGSKTERYNKHVKYFIRRHWYDFCR